MLHENIIHNIFLPNPKPLVKLVLRVLIHLNIILSGVTMVMKRMIPPEMLRVSGCTCKKPMMFLPANRNNIKMINAKQSSRTSTTRRRLGSRCFKMESMTGRLPSGSMIKKSMVAADKISISHYSHRFKVAAVYQPSHEISMLLKVTI